MNPALTSTTLAVMSSGMIVSGIKASPIMPQGNGQLKTPPKENSKYIENFLDKTKEGPITRTNREENQIGCAPVNTINNCAPAPAPGSGPNSGSNPISYSTTTIVNENGSSITSGSATSSTGTTTYTSTTTPNSDGSSSTSTIITSPQGQTTTLKSTSTFGPIPTTIATLTPPGTTYKATSTPDGIGMLSTTTPPSNTTSETNTYNGNSSSVKDIAITAALAETSKGDNSLAIGLGLGLGLTALGAIAFFAIKNIKTEVHINDTATLENEFHSALIEYKEKYENADYAEKKKLANALAEAGLKYGDAVGGGRMINVSQATYDAFEDAKKKSDADKDNNIKSYEKHTSAEVFAKEAIDNNRRFLEDAVVITIAGRNFGSRQLNDNTPPVVAQPSSKTSAPITKNTLYALERGR